MSTATAAMGVEKKKRPAFKAMTPAEKAIYYGELKEKREARAANKFVPPAGASYINEDGLMTCTITPEGWDGKVHADFVMADFAAEHYYLDFRAGLLEAKAAKLRLDAETSRKGGPRLKGDAKKLLAYQEKFEALRKSLEAEGVDVSAILAGIAK